MTYVAQKSVFKFITGQCKYAHHHAQVLNYVLWSCMICLSICISKLQSPEATGFQYGPLSSAPPFAVPATLTGYLATVNWYVTSI